MAEAGLNTLVQQLRTLVTFHHYKDLSDGSLLERFVSQGDELAFKGLVRRHGPLVLGVGRRVLGAGPDLDDVFQATFMVLARKAGSIRRQESVASWLYGVAFQLSRKLKRQLDRRRKHEHIGGRLEAIAESRSMVVDPGERASMGELAAILDEEIQRLPKKNREALVLCHLEGISAAEAAKRLRCPLPTLKSRLVRARELICQRLVRRGVTLSAAGVAVVFAEHAAGATVPHKVVNAAVQAAVAFATKPIACATVSVQAAALAKGVLKTMTIAKLSLAIFTAFTVALLGFGMAMVSAQAAKAPPQDLPIPPIAESDQPAAGISKDQAKPAVPSDAPSRSPFDAWTDAGAEYGWIRIDAFGGAPNWSIHPKDMEGDATHASPFSKDVLAMGHYSAVRFAQFPIDKLRLLPVLETCTRLWLDGSSVDDDNLREVALLKNLEWLALYRSIVSDAGLKNLAGLKYLRRLGLHNTKVTDAGMKDLARHTRLEALGIGDTAVTDAGLKELAGLKQLRLLDLYGTPITDAGMTTVTGFTQMETLHLSDAVTDQGLEKLATLSKLKYVVTHGNVTDEGRRKLQKALPRVRIER